MSSPLPDGHEIRPERTSRGLRRGLASAALMAVLAVAAHGAVAQPAGTATRPPRPWGVVTLNATDATLPAFMIFDAAFRSALGTPQDRTIDIYAESFDLFRFRGAQIEDDLLNLLSRKYASLDIDIVVTVGPSALDFADRHRARLWPHARIVFQEVPDGWLRDRTLGPGTTGTSVRYAFRETAELALRLQPQMRRLVIVAGAGDYDRALGPLALYEVASLAGRVAIEPWSELPLEPLLERLGTLDPRYDAVLYVSMGRDGGGRTFVPREALQQVAAASRAPVYGAFETYLGFGVTAGVVHGFEASGNNAGKLVNELLVLPAGAPVPPVTKNLATCAADARQLARHGIRTSSLPAGCDLRHATPSLWEAYRWYVLGALVLLLAQSGLIFGLLWQRRGRHVAEAEARRRRNELSQASRLALAGELTASIAHEINQPLGAILANAGAAEAMLRRGVVDTDELRAILADIRKSDERASDIIRRVRSLVTSHSVEREPTDLKVLVEDVLGLLEREARRRQVALHRSLPEGLPKLLVDRVQLQQALLNLCVNAMDAMSDLPAEWRKLDVGISRTETGDVEITVSDTGPGIAPEKLPYLFDSFFTTKPHGMGLGLSITRSIVEAHGGSVWARNLAEGGALFRIVLPANTAGVDEGVTALS